MSDIVQAGHVRRHQRGHFARKPGAVWRATWWAVDPSSGAVRQFTADLPTEAEAHRALEGLRELCARVADGSGS